LVDLKDRPIRVGAVWTEPSKLALLERFLCAQGEAVGVVGYVGNIAGSTIARVDPGTGELLDLAEAYVWVEALPGTAAGLW
jgi:hypothetical protein